MHFIKILEQRIFKIPVLYLVLLALLMSLVFLTPLMGIKIWAGFIGLTLFLFIIFITFQDIRYSLILLLIYTYFLFLIAQYINIGIPIGAPFDIILGLIFIVILLRSFLNADEESNPFTKAAGIALLVWGAYDFIQIFNPYSGSIMKALDPIRITVAFLIGYYVFYKAFRNTRFIKIYMITWLILSLLGALYGLKQEFLGLSSVEWNSLVNDPRRYKLVFQWGHIRKWSFFSDVSSFGITMAFSAIVCFILALGPFNRKLRIASVFSGLIMMVSMSYSGTRTATAMIPIGLAAYFLLNLKNRITIGIAIAAIVGFVIIMYGPFYGSTLTRIRSTFNPDDPSLSFRQYKRQKLQTYVMGHPIGGGLGSADFTAGRLSTTNDPDNGYLRTALDTGIPGLFIQLGLYFTLMVTGINGYFSTRNRKYKFLYAAFLAAFFAITIAQFFQDAIQQKPANLVVISYMALIVRLREFDHRQGKNKTDHH